MRTKAYFCVCLCIVVSLAGCEQQSGERIASIQQAAPTFVQSEADLICLADPSGNSVLDQRIRSLQKQAAVIPRKTESWILIGRAWVQKARITMDPGFYINVESCANAALERDPASSAARSIRALTLMNNHRFTEARFAAEEILREDPQDLIAHGVRSDALLELGELDLATEAVQQMMDIRPDMASYSRASYIRWLRGDNSGARLLIRDALEARNARDPEPAAWTYVQAGMLFWHEGDYEGADAVFAEALKWVPDYPPALVAAGRVALSRNQPQRAEALLQKAFDLHPLPETAWLLGDALLLKGDKAGADRAYRNVVDLGRKSDPLTLALFYATTGTNLTDALRLVEEERKKRSNIYVEDTYAWVLFRLGRFSEAQSVMEKAMQFGTKDARLLFHAGAIRMANGDSSGRALIRSALALNRMFDRTGAKEAQALISDGEQYAKEL